MTKILFVCLGNICRSPMAEFVLRDMAEKAGLAEQIAVASAATSAWEIGNPVYPPAREEMRRHGIDCSGKTARQITPQDYTDFDRIIGMDERNMQELREFFGGDPAGKLSMMLDYTDRPGQVADPYYTGDFRATWQDVQEGCAGLLRALADGKKQK